MNDEIKTLRDLRNALFQIDNQKMTVQELRQMLTQMAGQDKPVEIMDLRTAEILTSVKI